MQRIVKSVIWVVFASLLAAIAALTYYQFFTQSTAKVAEYSVQRKVKFSFTVRNPNNYPLKQSELWVYAPIKSSAFQQLGTLDATAPYHLTEDDQWSERLVFAITELPPYGSKNISVTASVNLSEQGSQVGVLQTETYLNDDSFLGLANPDIQRLASILRADKPRDTAEKIYKWITVNIKKTGYVKNDRGAVQALETRSGDCTEFMYLFSALARLNGIPTRNMAGFVAGENRVLRPADYHNWKEVFIWSIPKSRSLCKGHLNISLCARLIIAHLRGR